MECTHKQITKNNFLEYNATYYVPQLHSIIIQYSVVKSNVKEVHKNNRIHDLGE